MKETSINEFSQALSKCGIEKGDVVLVHSDIFQLGIISSDNDPHVAKDEPHSKQVVKKYKQSIENIYTGIWDAIGESESSNVSPAIYVL